MTQRHRIFPSVVDAGFGIGGQYGERSLRVGGRTVGYYSTVTASIGWQIGSQSRAIIFLFITEDALGGSMHLLTSAGPLVSLIAGILILVVARC